MKNKVEVTIRKNKIKTRHKIVKATLEKMRSYFFALQQLKHCEPNILKCRENSIPLRRDLYVTIKIYHNSLQSSKFDFAYAIVETLANK